MALIIDEIKPQVMVTYDENGGYGHPDHIQTHRVAMRLKLGRAITSDDDVLHACNNKLCVNPSHLYIRDDKNRNEQITITSPKILAVAK
mgnify:CR=1 FL=1